jgi:hypothetical protein
MGESRYFRRDVTDCPKGCAGSRLEASEGVDRLLRSVFAMPLLQPSPLLRQQLRQRIAHEDSLWRPLERLAKSHGEGFAKFFTLPIQGSRCSDAPSELRTERRSDRSQAQ